MKTTRMAETKRESNIRVLESALDMCDANLRGSQGSEKVRIQGEIDGILEQLKRLGA